MLMLAIALERPFEIYERKSGGGSQLEMSYSIATNLFDTVMRAAPIRLLLSMTANMTRQYDVPVPPGTVVDIVEPGRAQAAAMVNHLDQVRPAPLGMTRVKDDGCGRR